MKVATVLVALALLGLVAPSAQGVPAPGTSGSTTLDLTRPTTGIKDSLEAMTPFDRNCKPGQVDVNTASAAEIGSTFVIHSGPTLDRVLASRPWLKAADLNSVPGVPTSSSAVLTQKGCATPTQQPEPAPQSCVAGTDAVDVQSASSEAMALKLGLPHTTADALVANRPLPQNLHLVATPRTPGLSDPKIDRLLAAKAYCVTPAPYTFSGTTWRWASATGGAVVAAAGNSSYALIIPPGTVSGSTGAWGMVTPTPSSNLPGADFHIFGDWAGEVGARMPDPAPGTSVGVIHYTQPQNPSLSWGSSVVHESGGTVITALHSLSGVVAIDRGDLCAGQAMVNHLNHDDSSLLCAGGDPRDIPLLQFAAQLGDEDVRYIASFPDPGPCPNAYTRAQSSGGFPLGVGCGVEVAPDQNSATWTFTNNTDDKILHGLVESFGAVYLETGLGDPGGYSRTGTIPDDIYGEVSGPAAHEYVDAGWLLPGTSLSITKRAGSGESAFRHSPKIGELNHIYMQFQLLELADGVAALAGHGRFTGPLVCIKNFLDRSVDSKTTGSCIQAAIGEELHALSKSPDIPAGSTAAKVVEGASKVLEGVGWGVAADSYVTSLVAQVSARISGDKVVTLNYLRPPAPIGGGGSHTIDPGAYGPTGGDGHFIARTPQGDGYLYNPSSGQFDHIKDGNTFLCYATRYVVMDQVERTPDGNHLNFEPPLAISSVDTDRCLTTPFIVWDYSPAPAGNTPRNVILRGSEDDGPPVSSWLINNAGEIQTIRDPGVYVCLAATNPVIWNVPFAKIQAWQPVGSVAASCGPPGP
jgi:hypothetical protein